MNNSGYIYDDADIVLTLQDLAALGLLSEKIKAPANLFGANVDYDILYSIVTIKFSSNNVPTYKVNLSFGEQNYFFPEIKSLEQISRSSFTPCMKEYFNFPLIGGEKCE